MYEVRAFPLDDGLIVVFRDVTAARAAAAERAALVAAAARGEADVRALVGHMPELAWTARADGHIDFYNRRWYEYTGATIADMEGWGWKSVHDPALLDRVAHGGD